MGKLVTIATKARFDALREASNISETSLNFILETGLLYTHNIFINGASFGTATSNYIPVKIGGVTKNLSLNGHTHSNYYDNSSDIDIGSNKIKSGTLELLKYSSDTLILGNSSIPTEFFGTLKTTKDGTKYTILDTNNFSIVNKTSTNLTLNNVALFKYGSSSFQLDYVRRYNTVETFNNLAKYTSAGTTNENSKAYGFITLSTDTGTNTYSYAQIRVSIPDNTLEFRTSSDTTWKGTLLGGTYRNITINGTTYSIVTKAGSLPTIIAPTALGTSGQYLTTSDDGKSLTWRTLPTDNNTWRPIAVNGTEKRSSSTGSGNLDIINGTNTTIEWTSGNKLKINAVDTWTAFVGASDSVAGTAGYVSAPGKGNQGKFFRGDGTWATPTNTWNAANTSQAGYVPQLTTGGGTISTQASEYVLTYVSSGSGTVTPTWKLLPANAFKNDNTWKAANSSQEGYVPKSIANKILRSDANGALYWGDDSNTWKEVTTSLEGYVPKIVTTGSLAATDSPFILVFKNVSGSTKTAWVPLPANAFKNDNTWTPWVGATASANGTAGYMPAPTSAQRGQFLRGDGSWVSLNNYSLPTASSSTLGGVKTGAAITDTTGYTAVAIKDGVIYYKDTNTTYSFSNLLFLQTSGTNLMTYNSQATRTVLAGSNITFTHSNNVLTITAKDTTYSTVSKSAAGLCPALPNETTTTKYLRLDGSWVTPPNDNTWRGIYVGGTSKVGTGTNTLPINFVAGSNVSITYEAAGTGSGQSGNAGYFNVKIAATDTTYSDFVKSGSTAAHGLVPKPPTTAGTTKYLREDGTWQTPPNDNTWKAANASQEGYVPKSTANKILRANGDGALYWGDDANTTYTFYNLLFQNSGGTTVDTYKPTTSPTKTLKAGSNVTISAASNVITIASTNTWNANAVGVAGYVAAPTKAANANMTWLTDADGNPAWRASNNHSHSYLPLSGGTLTNNNFGEQLTIKRSYAGGDSVIKYDSNGATVGYIGIKSDKTPVFYAGTNTSGSGNLIYHSGNLPAYPTKASWNYDDVYIKSVSISGNNLRINKNGANTDLTIPYATNADTVDSLHASNLVRFFLSPMTAGAPADSAKSWFTGTMPSASGAIIYNVPGSEKTIIAGKSSGAYGHMLQLGYDDNYLRLLRYQGGSWKTTDWEKISAGYADSAGSVAWSNVTGKPLSGDSGNNGPVWGNYVPVKSDGVMEIGKYIDFHNSSNDGVDYAVRLMCQGNNQVIINLPTSAGTLALTSQIPTKASWNYNDMYVSSLTTSGNSLRWVKNGSNNDITIPYATSASSANGLGVNSSSFTTGAVGWYRLAMIATTDPRGSVRIGLITVGGSFTPFYAELYVKNGWSNTDFILYGRFDYITKFRLTKDSTNTYIEGYFPTANTAITLRKIKALGYVNDYETGWTLYTSATAGGGTIDGNEFAKSSSTSIFYCSGYLEAKEFVKSGSSDSYVLLGGGGQAAISGLSVSYASSAGSVAWSNVASKPAATGGATTPVYWNGSGFTNCTAYANASVNYATSAGSATNASNLVSNTRMDYGWNGINYFNLSAANLSAAKVNDTPYSSAVWTHILRFNHANNSGYYTDLAIPFNGNGIYYKRIAGGSLQNSTTNGGWVSVLDNLNSSVSKSGETLTVKINGTSQSLTNTNTTYSASTGLSLSGTAFSVSSTYQTYISHGESAYNSLGNYYPVINSAGKWSASGGGNNAYCLIAEINTNAGYINYPVTFEIGGRGTIVSRVTIRFANQQAADPDCNLFATDEATCFYLYKAATNTWRLYAGSPSDGVWGVWNVYRVFGNIAGRVTMKMEAVNSLPSGYKSVTYTGNVGYASSAGSIAWGNVTGKPETATRWPSWSEVTSKPSSFTPSSHTHNMNDIKWPGGHNLVTSATANGQEWSIDCTPGTYTGTYWLVWRATSSGISTSGTMLKVDCDTGKVSAPYGFVGNLSGTATSAGNADTVDSQHATRFGWVYNSSNYGNSSTVTANDLASSGGSNATFGMVCSGTDNPTGAGKWVHVWSQQWTINVANNWVSQIAIGTLDKDGMWYRATNSNGGIAGVAWKRIIDSSNYSSYALPKSGGTVTGNVTIKGTANTDTALSLAGSQYTMDFLIGSGNVNRGIYNRTSNAWMFYFDASNTIMNYGNVGIGTTSPSYKLHVNGNGYYSGSLTINGNTIPNSDNAYNLGSTSNYWQNVYHYNSCVWNHVNIGYQKGQYTANRAELTIISRTDVPADIYFGSSNTYKWQLSSRASGESYKLNFYCSPRAGSSFTALTLDQSGNVYATNFYTTSDRNKKQNISSLSEHIRKFQLKDTEKWHYGVIAQEVPEMFRDGEEGNMTVNYTSILSYYVGLLENKVASLEKELSILKQKLK